MSYLRRDENFIDKAFTTIADLLLEMIPTSQNEKNAFVYYRNGLVAQSEGEYAEALNNYYEALQLEKDSLDRRYILYNIALIYTANGQYGRALEYYFASLDRNPSSTQVLNNVAVLYHFYRERTLEQGHQDLARILFFRAAEYWKEAIRIAPTNYIEAQNWLLITGRI